VTLGSAAVALSLLQDVQEKQKTKGRYRIGLFAFGSVPEA
jgi:hypothetical protein